MSTKIAGLTGIILVLAMLFWSWSPKKDDESWSQDQDTVVSYTQATGIASAAVLTLSTDSDLTVPKTLVINSRGGAEAMVTIYLDDGHVERAPGFSDDEAAAAFWEAIEASGWRTRPVCEKKQE